VPAGVSRPLRFNKRPTRRGDMLGTRPRLLTSSANSRGVQGVTGRPESAGASPATATLWPSRAGVHVAGRPRPGWSAPHRLEEGAPGRLVGLRFRRHQLRGGLAPARTPAPAGGGADPEDLGQMPGPGAGGPLQDHRGPWDLIGRTAAASSDRRQQSPLAVGELNQGGAGPSWFAQRDSSGGQA
jgi:hypothetical protein